MSRETVEDPIIAYKTILAQIIDNRPSGTRQRLAEALGKHRSFVTQVTSPAYSTPLPARHLATIFRVCHFSPGEQERFLQAYQSAHPGKLPDFASAEKLRQLSLIVPDLGDEKKNRLFDEVIEELVRNMAKLVGTMD
ncbi:hypothetical protein N181_22060 [Sinorhizobium fredii USDA 205]|uniref:Uncharacterized protein n=1 Tax=Rhizobium fredii TaxID=380 RepID=A0A844A4L1_RHIFR|nr:hypothetical protein [Sinorhizobium fredii]ASY71649.1 hypothetical protein SF83666_b50000 [Sinorhizobium fredii CCBAU 83666]AWM29267.1 hypothetical protein AOX55_00006492 [Sinorhizobium fredii CCBAU 25509]KSV86155.1 hypothetical protein N181_22060 [Sinorhizobium fredii USDA 205]MQX07437.1 hypothetical protein [Sinorhizobium fredii]GEC34333.1 hypothetical protein EFR01_45040 [Sinorhizobium fredii]